MTFCASEFEDTFSESGDDLEKLLSQFYEDVIWVGRKKDLADCDNDELEMAEGEGWSWLVVDAEQFFVGEHFDYVDDGSGADICNVVLTEAGRALADKVRGADRLVENTRDTKPQKE